MQVVLHKKTFDERAAAVIACAAARQRLQASPAVARALRERSGLTQREVADALRVSVASVSRWETGKRVPRGRLAAKYFELLRRANGATP